MSRVKGDRDSFLMGTFAVPVVDYVKAVRWMELSGMEVEGRNSVLRILVEMAADMFEREFGEGARELTVEDAHRWVDNRFPVKNYREGKRSYVEKRGKMADSMLRKVRGEGEDDERGEEMREFSIGNLSVNDLYKMGTAKILEIAKKLINESEKTEIRRRIKELGVESSRVEDALEKYIIGLVITTVGRWPASELKSWLIDNGYIRIADNSSGQILD